MEYKKIFISYKHDGGYVWANLLYYGLIACQIAQKEEIFLDCQNLSGDWQSELDSALKSSINVIVVLSEGFSEKIHDDDIWIAELRKAEEYKRVIIPFYVSENIEKSIIEQCEKIPKDKKIAFFDLLQKKHYQEVIYNPKYNIEGIFHNLKNQFRTYERVCVRINMTSRKSCHVKCDDMPWEIIDQNKPSLDFYLDKGREGDIMIEAYLPESRMTYHLSLDRCADKCFREKATKCNGLELYKIIPSDKDSFNIDFSLDWDRIQLDLLVQQTSVSTLAGLERIAFDLRNTLK